jgi:hypothetical protein
MADREGFMATNQLYSYAAANPLFFLDAVGLEVNFAEPWLQERYNQLKECFRLFSILMQYFEESTTDWNIRTDPPGNKCILHPRIRGVPNGIWVPREGPERGNYEENCKNTMGCIFHEFYERWLIDAGGLPPSEMGTGVADKVARKIQGHIPFAKCCSCQ